MNLPALMGIDRSPSETFMQIHGAGLRIGVERLREAMAQSPTLMPILLRFVHVYMVQTASTVLANGRARIPERLARWLLMAGDRVDGEGIALTHEFLATMLGVRRPGVTIAVREFERRGLIDGGRGVITLLDRRASKPRRTATMAPRRRSLNACSPPERALVWFHTDSGIVACSRLAENILFAFGHRARLGWEAHMGRTAVVSELLDPL